MGGYGSGRRSTKPKVEECSSIDANQLNRDGCLKNGWNGTMAWSRNGQKFSSIGMRATADYLHLGYSSERYGSVIQPIRIERLPCRFGGSRAYFRCDCGKRVVKLYGFGQVLPVPPLLWPIPLQQERRFLGSIFTAANKA